MIMHAWTIAAVSLVSLSAASAAAKGGCREFQVREGPAQRRADAALVTRVGRQHVIPAQIGDVLADGPWRFVWATPSGAERGVFFFRRDAKRRYRLMETWGGVLSSEERADTIRWVQARRGHPPRALAACFVDRVIAGR
jgi:hypothetical protein